MRKYLLAIIFALAPMCAFAQQTFSFTGATAPIDRSHDFQNSEGVTTQIGSGDASQTAATIAADMSTLGITNYRDADFASNTTEDAEFEAISCPVNKTKVVNHVTLLTSAPGGNTQALQFASANLDSTGMWPLIIREAEAQTLNTSKCAGMVSALEGSNEINAQQVEITASGGTLYGNGCVEYYYNNWSNPLELLHH